MRKILSIISLFLVGIFCFSACTKSTDVAAKVVKDYKDFISKNTEYFSSATIVSENLKIDYAKHEKAPLEENLFLVKNSNLVMEKLISYFETETFTKKIKSKEFKELEKLFNVYYTKFSDFKNSLKTLELVVANNNTNLSNDYQILNKQIGDVVIAGCDVSSQIISIISSKTDINFYEDQESVSTGATNLFLIDCYNNLLNAYANIYLKESALDAKYVLDETAVENPIFKLKDIADIIKSSSGSIYDLSPEEFINYKQSLISLQAQNNSLKSKLKVIDKNSSDLISNLNDKGKDKKELSQTAIEQIKSSLHQTITTEIYPGLTLLSSTLNDF